MKKQNYLTESDTISRDIVKLAISLPENSIGKHVKIKLVESATLVSSLFQVACLDNGKESIDKFNSVLEKAGVSSFWLKFLRDEGITPAANVNGLIDKLSGLISTTLCIKKYEEKVVRSTTSYAGEWFLDD